MLKVAFDSSYIHPLPENHRFPMEKYDLLPRQLMYEGVVSEEHFFNPGLIDEAYLKGIHTADYLNRLFTLQLSKKEQRVSGFVHSETLIQRESRIMEGTRKCAELALKEGAAMNIAGGTHHAYSDRGEGFCLMNDQAIAANWLMNETAIKSILIIDLDVHQGNGTAEIFQTTPSVVTFSVHGKNNYPLRKEQSDYDVELDDQCSDKDYLNSLNRSLDQILSNGTPDFIFYQCGVDVLMTDKLGRLGLTKQGCLERDKMVFNVVKQLGVPVVCTMGGGYSPKIKDIVDAHANTFKAIQEELF